MKENRNGEDEEKYKWQLLLSNYKVQSTAGIQQMIVDDRRSILFSFMLKLQQRANGERETITTKSNQDLKNGPKSHYSNSDI